MKGDDQSGMVSSQPEPPVSPLLAAGRMLADRGIYGLVWFDDDLYVTARYGRLADFVEVGEPLSQHCLALVGLEDHIKSLKDRPGELLDLPAVLLATEKQPLPRLNLTVFWFAEGGHYLMLLARTTSRSDIETELSKQMRARLIAESELAAKSRKLARANSELERANRDLEDFAAIISHDLKSPLRALRYTAEDLGTLIEAGQLHEAQSRIAEIGERTRRMSDMMTSLLDYASVGRKSEITEPVDTADVIAAITHSLACPKQLTIEIAGTWPRIETVRAALDLVLRNLIQNAIVHHDRNTGRIVVEAEDAATGLVFSVADDGPGIDPAHHKVILLPFRTLGGRLGTTGMGLAFVNRMIEAVGGRIEIRSDPSRGRGTTFRVHWPRQIKL